MTLWRILSILGIVIAIMLIVMLIFVGLLKNKYYHEYKEDELIKDVKAVNSKNKIFFTSGQTRKNIKRYALCETAFDKYVICDFNEKFKYISYYVLTYNAKKKVKSVIFVTEENTNLTSKVISVPNNTKFVNIVIKNVNGSEINTNVIKPLSIIRIRLYSLVTSIIMFLILNGLRQLIVEIVAGIYQEIFLESIYNIFALIGCFVISLIYYWCQTSSLRKKNIKYTSGGSLEYEFY